MNPTVEHRNRPCRGETRSGDAVIVRVESDWTLLSVVDVLGHGNGAAEVADLAVAFLLRAPLHQGVQAIIEGLHVELRSTRGAAGTVCLVGHDHLEASGVGNVSLRVFGSPLSVMLTPGILGSRMRSLRVFTGKRVPSTRLVFHSDGIRGRFSTEEATAASPKDTCDNLMRAYARAEDDATILIADLP